MGDDATDETLKAIATVNDPRVRFEDLPERSPIRTILRALAGGGHAPSTAA